MHMKPHLFFTFLILFTLFQGKAQNATNGKEFNIVSDDVTLYGKEYGKGEPVILLHGAMVDIDDWENQIPALATRYRVIVFDSRGHGKSSFTDKPMSYQLMSDDLLNVMRELKIDSASFIGFGDGGNILIELAINHPEKIKKMILIGANLKPTPDAVYPYFLQKVKDWDLDKMTLLLKSRFIRNPNPELLNTFARRMQFMLLNEPKWELKDMSQIAVPTLVMASDYGLVTVRHSFDIFENLQNANLCVIPGSKHYSIKEKPALVNTVIMDFLNQRFEKIARY